MGGVVGTGEVLEGLKEESEIIRFVFRKCRSSKCPLQLSTAKSTLKGDGCMGLEQGCSLPFWLLSSAALTLVPHLPATRGITERLGVSLERKNHSV